MQMLVTAGPTREAIDPIRYISNHSSGKMGYAIAAVAAGRGHDVTLVSGPTCLPTPAGVERIDVVTAAEMLAAVMTHLPKQNALVMAAAVSDWRPRTVVNAKIKKGATQSFRLDLERTEDILQRVQSLKGRRIHMGFCAETGDPTHEARRKLMEKGLDVVVANDVTQPGVGFGWDTNQVTLHYRNGAMQELPLQAKRDVALRLVEAVEALSRQAAG